MIHSYSTTNSFRIQCLAHRRIFRTLNFSQSTRSRDSSVGIATGYGLDGQGFDSQIFLFSIAPRPTLGLTQPPIQGVLGDLSPGVKVAGGVKLSTRLHPVPRSTTRLHDILLN
jgi:hypothetical protein